MRKNPRVIGVKNSSMPVQDIQMFKAVAGEDYVIFNGPDEQFMSGRVIGAEGAIGGTYGVIKAMLKINEGLELGGVREPLPALIESDMAIVEEAAKMVRDAKEKFL